MKKTLLKIIQTAMLFVLIATAENKIGVSVAAIMLLTAAYAEGLFQGGGDL